MHQSINIFTPETLSLSFVGKEFALPSQMYFEHTTFLLFLTVTEFCNISNKYWLSNKSAKTYFYTRYVTPSFISNKNCALHRRRLKKHPLFYQFSQWMRCAIFQTYTNLLGNLAKYQYFSGGPPCKFIWGDYVNLRSLILDNIRTLVKALQKRNRWKLLA